MEGVTTTSSTDLPQQEELSGVSSEDGDIFRGVALQHEVTTQPYHQFCLMLVLMTAIIIRVL